MTIHKPPRGDDPRSMLSNATVLYETAADVFALVIDEARSGEARAAKEAVGYAKEFRQALLAVLNERAAIEKLRRDAEGVVHDRTLDLEQARVEIGRRLACLRDAAGG